MRLHAGFMMDPTAARVRKTHFTPFRMQNLQRFAGRRSPGREIPHAPETRSPRPPKHGKRSGRGATGGSDGRRGRSSGCDRPRLRALMRMRGTRHARYLQTLPQPYSCADIFLCSYCYCRYYVDHIATAAILRRYSLHKYSLRKHTIHTHITHPLLCLPPSSHHILNPDPIFPPSHKENT